MNAKNEIEPAVAELQGVLTDLVKCAVTKPEAVKVKHSVHGNLVAFFIETEQVDVKRVLGSKGKHFKALESIMRTLAKISDRETLLTIKDDGPPPPGSQGQRQFSPPVQGSKMFERVPALLKRIIGLYLETEPQVVVADFGQTAILEIKIKDGEKHYITGPDADFEYGRDGLIIGSIKNIFDGIGKNHGKVLKITVTEV
jgi:predicted RNA-binding protein YlqC (UPF0109 family)